MNWRGREVPAGHFETFDGQIVRRRGRSDQIIPEEEALPVIDEQEKTIEEEIAQINPVPIDDVIEVAVEAENDDHTTEQPIKQLQDPIIIEIQGEVADNSIVDVPPSPPFQIDGSMNRQEREIEESTKELVAPHSPKRQSMTYS